MKLLSRSDAQSKVKRDNDELIDTNLRLRRYESTIIKKLNAIKDDYEPEKIARLKEFESFCAELSQKKSKLLEELSGLQKLIDQKKDIYYGLIAKQDALDEKIYEMKEVEKKLDLREALVLDLEKKWREKNN